jgi:outer membrane receptor protein involved in Fe transport
MVKRIAASRGVLGQSPNAPDLFVHQTPAMLILNAWRIIMKKHLRLLLLFVLLISLTHAYAQDGGTIKGSVTDPNRAAVVGAKVIAVASGARQSREAITDAQGQYTLGNLPPGKYTITASAQNFQPVSREVNVSANEGSTADFQLPVQRLEQQMEVSAATRYERSAADVPVSVTIIPRKEVLASPGRTIDDDLRYVAGVNMQRDSADVIFPVIPSIAMRGLGVGDTATRSLVLVDGLPINGGFWGAVLWNRAPEYTVDRLEVVRGSTSSLFGSFAMGGAVNVVTHVPEKREFNGEFLYGQNDRFRGNLQYGDVVANERVAYSLNANYYTTDGYFLVPEDERRPINERQHANQKNFQGRANFKLNDFTQAFIRGGYSDQARTGGFQLSRTDAVVGDVAGGFDIDLKAGGLVSTRLFYSNEKVDIDNVRVASDTLTFVSNRHDNNADVIGWSAQWSKGFNQVLSRLTAGVDLRWVEGGNDQDVFNTPNVLNANIIGAGTQTANGLFGEVSLRPFERFEFLGSLRFDHFRDADGRIVTNGTAQLFPTRTFNLASPRLAARYQFVEALALRGAYYEGFRAPTLAERYRSFESPTFRGLSNPDLEEERLRGGDVGLDIRHRRFDGQVNYFYNHLRNFVGSAEFGFVGGKFTVINTNVAKIRSRGVELIGNLRFTDHLSLLGNYTYTDSEVVEGPFQGNQTEGAPRHVASFALNYFAPFGLSLSPRGRWIDDAFQDITAEAPMDEHFIFDFRAAQRVHKHFELVFVAENLFNRQYISDGFGQILGAPRQISGGIRFTF